MFDRGIAKIVGKYGKEAILERKQDKWHVTFDTN